MGRVVWQAHPASSEEALVQKSAAPACPRPQSLELDTGPSCPEAVTATVQGKFAPTHTLPVPTPVCFVCSVLCLVAPSALTPDPKSNSSSLTTVYLLAFLGRRSPFSSCLRKAVFFLALGPRSFQQNR